jgi:hypothetical protein
MKIKSQRITIEATTLQSIVEEVLKGILDKPGADVIAESVVFNVLRRASVETSFAYEEKPPSMGPYR